MRLLLVASCLWLSSASAQPGSPLLPGAWSEASAAAPADSIGGGGTTRSLDERAFRAVYGVEAPAFGAAMRGFEASSLPVSVAAAPVWLGVALATGSDARPALRLGAAQAGGYAVTGVLKEIVRRPRPYASLPDVRPRGRAVRRLGASASWPSGHATLAWATAVSAGLSEPNPAVVVPAVAWASGVSLARVWHGVHYPSDVLAGAAVGAGAAVLVHALIPGGRGGQVLSVRVGL